MFPRAGCASTRLRWRRVCIPLVTACGLVLAAAFISGRPSGANEGAARPGPVGRTVVLVSFDGLRWDDPQRAGSEAFERMRREGVSAVGLVPPFPASTFPAHATLATGVYPDRHGIVANRFFDRERGAYHKDNDPSWLQSEPIWVTAERQGVATAVSHWVFAGSAWHGTATAVREPYSPGVSDNTKIDAIIQLLQLPRGERPRLIMSYLRGVDGTSHRAGPASAEVDDAVRTLDRLVERLLSAAERIDDGAAVIVVSDHGMTAVRRIHRLDLLLSGDAGGVRAFSSGGSANLYCQDEIVCRAARERLEAIPALRVYALGALPPGLHYGHPGRTGDLVVVAPPGDLLLSRAPRGAAIGTGTHGYHSKEREMWGVFYAWGSGLRAGVRLDHMNAVDLVPLICRLLGIDPPVDIDGRLRAGLLVAEEAR